MPRPPPGAPAGACPGTGAWPIATYVTVVIKSAAIANTQRVRFIGFSSEKVAKCEQILSPALLNVNTSVFSFGRYCESPRRYATVAESTTSAGADAGGPPRPPRPPAGAAAGVAAGVTG